MLNEVKLLTADAAEDAASGCAGKNQAGTAVTECTAPKMTPSTSAAP